MFEEHRIEPRESLSIPLRLGDGSTALTRDISASGMYFEVVGPCALAGPVVFEMQIAEIGMKFTAEGEIVRVERHNGTTGFAIRLRQPRFESL